MNRGSHSLAPTTVRRRRFVLLAAPLVTALAVGTGVVTSGAGQPESSAATSGSLDAATGAASLSQALPRPARSQRTLGTSRSTERVALVDNRVPKATGKLWTTARLDLRVQPREKTEVAGLLKSDKRIAVTGRRQGGFAEVIVNRTTTRWVTADYLSKKKQTEQASGPAGVSTAPCPDGSGIEAGLQPAAAGVYRAACAAFPELTTYGGQDGHGEHVNGEAIDFMVPSASTGQRLSDFLYANRGALDLFDIIYAQRIWTIERSAEGFRSMSDRGSATANHYDHVHIKVN